MPGPDLTKPWGLHRQSHHFSLFLLFALTLTQFLAAGGFFFSQSLAGGSQGSLPSLVRASAQPVTMAACSATLLNLFLSEVSWAAMASLSLSAPSMASSSEYSFSRLALVDFFFHPPSPTLDALRAAPVAFLCESVGALRVGVAAWPWTAAMLPVDLLTPAEAFATGLAFFFPIVTSMRGLTVCRRRGAVPALVSMTVGAGGPSTPGEVGVVGQGGVSAESVVVSSMSTGTDPISS
mmetsp:Transcript_18107/g.41947  ORF Transcript_18107/g.41947 Transcript_18107/m.41947 type:complete len:236 (+) Transcript_18107:414-1121(+)